MYRQPAVILEHILSFTSFCDKVACTPVSSYINKITVKILTKRKLEIVRKVLEKWRVYRPRILKTESDIEAYESPIFGTRLANLPIEYNKIRREIRWFWTRLYWGSSEPGEYCMFPDSAEIIDGLFIRGECISQVCVNVDGVLLWSFHGGGRNILYIDFPVFIPLILTPFSLVQVKIYATEIYTAESRASFLNELDGILLRSVYQVTLLPEKLYMRGPKLLSYH